MPIVTHEDIKQLLFILIKHWFELISKHEVRLILASTTISILEFHIILQFLFICEVWILNIGNKVLILLHSLEHQAYLLQPYQSLLGCQQFLIIHAFQDSQDLIDSLTLWCRAGRTSATATCSSFTNIIIVIINHGNTREFIAINDLKLITFLILLGKLAINIAILLPEREEHLIIVFFIDDKHAFQIHNGRTITTYESSKVSCRILFGLIIGITGLQLMLLIIFLSQLLITKASNDPSGNTILHGNDKFSIFTLMLVLREPCSVNMVFHQPLIP